MESSYLELPADTRTQAERPPTKEELAIRLNAARDQWATVSAKRQRQLFDGTPEEYASVKATYDELVAAYGRLEVEDRMTEWLGDGIQARLDGGDTAQWDRTDYETKRCVLAVNYWFDEQNTLRKMTKNTVEGKRTWKFVNAMSKFLNSGTRLQRIGKGVAFGAAAAAFGSVLGSVFGVAAAGGAVVAGARFARGYASAQREGMKQLEVNDFIEYIPEFDLEGHSEDPHADFFDKLHVATSERFERDTKKEQSTQRRAFVIGAGSVALGATMGWALSETFGGSVPSAHASTLTGLHEPAIVAEAYSFSAPINAEEALDHAIPFADVTPEASSHVVPTEDVTPLAPEHTVPTPDATPEAQSHDIPTGAPPVESDIDPGTGDPVTPDIPDTEAGSDADVFTVERGHGLIREFQQAAWEKGHDISGIDSQRMYELLRQKYGADGLIDVLDVDMDGTHEASTVLNDTYDHHGDTRISAPGEAQWRPGVEADFEKLLDAHAAGEELSYDVIDGKDMSDAAAVSEDVEAAIADSDASVNVITAQEGWYDTFDQLRAEGLITLDRSNYHNLLTVAGPELEKLHYGDDTPVAYFDRVMKEWRMNMSPDNAKLHPEAIRLLVRLSQSDAYDLAA